MNRALSKIITNIMKHIIVKSLLFITLLVSAQADSKHQKAINVKEREVVALKELKQSPNTVQVYVKGLICESCALGVRKKVIKLNFVDTNKPKNGVVLNAHAQLAAIFLKPGVAMDKKALVKAVKGAGYEAVTLYSLGKGKKLKSESLVK